MMWHNSGLRPPVPRARTTHPGEGTPATPGRPAVRAAGHGPDSEDPDMTDSCTRRGAGGPLSARLLLSTFCGALLLAACQSPRASGELTVTPEVAESTRRYKKEYLLSPGDSVDVVVRRHADVSRACVVRPDGYISLPLLDDVEAAGLSINELDARLTELLSERLRDPEVTVVATQTRPPVVYVLGEVVRPQPVQLRQASTAIQAIAYSGGFKNSAETESVAVIRLTEEGKLRAIMVELELSGQPAPYMALQNFLLGPDDIVFVPKRGISQLNEWLNAYVNQPLTGINTLLTTYTNYRLIEFIIDEEGGDVF